MGSDLIALNTASSSAYPLILLFQLKSVTTCLSSQHQSVGTDTLAKGRGTQSKTQYWLELESM